MNLEQQAADAQIAEIALAISILSLLISGASFGWNVFKEVGLRVRIAIDFYVGILVGGLANADERWVVIRCVNKGPGKVRVNNLNVKFRKLAGGGRSETGYAITMFERSVSSQLPVTLDVGEVANYFVPFTEECFLKLDVTDFSVSDTFGRSHKVSRRELDRARKEYVEAFLTRGPIIASSTRGAN
ncbi:MAG: hypothetical protein IKE66_05525 [Hyphomicrobium sp.]|nr:hypothetical protein [Hyphomicrobium sp.]